MQEFRSKHLWHSIILHHFTDNEWSFRLPQQSFIIFNNNSIGLLRASASLHRFYVIAHVQNFPVSVFNPINCVHVLLNGLENVYPTLLNPVEISIILDILFWIEMFTWSIFIQIGLLNHL